VEYEESLQRGGRGGSWFEGGGKKTFEEEVDLSRSLPVYLEQVR